MSQNGSATSRTRHVDTRYHFVQEFVMSGFIKIIFVRSADNMADPFTKNVIGEVYDSHVKEFVIDCELFFATGHHGQ